MSSLQDLLDSKNEELQKYNAKKDEVDAMSQELITYLDTLNRDKIWLRVFPDYDEMVTRLRNFETLLPNRDNIIAALNLNEALYTNKYQCKDCGIAKLKKDFLLELKCNCLCAICVNKRITNGQMECDCSPFTKEVNIEALEFVTECEGCFIKIPLKFMHSNICCRKHFFCGNCVVVVNDNRYCFLCSR